MLLLSAALNASADEVVTNQAPATARHEKTYTGTILSVDRTGQAIEVRDVLGLFHKRFKLGDNCTYTLTEKSAGTEADLRAGQKVRIGYQNAYGVSVADHILQEPMRFEGIVQSIDPQQHTLVVRHRMLDKVFTTPGETAVLLQGDKPGTLANVQVGERVTVTYEAPPGCLTARQIAQTSATFTGELTALDLSDRTLKAKTLFGTKEFELAKGCTIVVNGRLGRPLRELRPGDQVTVNYETVNGVCVANRIADGGMSPSQTTAQNSM